MDNISRKFVFSALASRVGWGKLPRRSQQGILFCSCLEFFRCKCSKKLDLFVLCHKFVASFRPLFDRSFLLDLSKREREREMEQILQQQFYSKFLKIMNERFIGKIWPTKLIEFCFLYFWVYRTFKSCCYSLNVLNLFKCLTCPTWLYRLVIRLVGVFSHTSTA